MKLLLCLSVLSVLCASVSIRVQEVLLPGVHFNSTSSPCGTAMVSSVPVV